MHRTDLDSRFLHFQVALQPGHSLRHLLQVILLLTDLLLKGLQVVEPESVKVPL